MVDLLLTSKLTGKPDEFHPGKLDVRFGADGNLKMLDDDEQIYIQNLMKSALDANRSVGYGIDIASFRGQKDLVVTRAIIQNRAIDTVAFMNRYYPLLRFKITTCNIIPLSDGLLLRVVLDKAILELTI